MGAWIEIGKTVRLNWEDMLSLPSWERGLKSYHFGACSMEFHVAPLVGAWIEIVQSDTSLQMQ